ncbi:hypothetical protein NDU88_001686 [Pleurodeles waltl]|uniref:Uncharacterized protein n=1 Tax=Pleurodeles waltl TaxID=8319 RepID=A0AAV7MMF2_PLEWA|nr:hypothetical protein NDU88_001686 [Pleurodeles waltl]
MLVLRLQYSSGSAYAAPGCSRLLQAVLRDPEALTLACLLLSHTSAPLCSFPYLGDTLCRTASVPSCSAALLLLGLLSNLLGNFSGVAEPRTATLAAWHHLSSPPLHLSTLGHNRHQPSSWPRRPRGGMRPLGLLQRSLVHSSAAHRLSVRCVRVGWFTVSRTHGPLNGRRCARQSGKSVAGGHRPHQGAKEFKRRSSAALTGSSIDTSDSAPHSALPLPGEDKSYLEYSTLEFSSTLKIILHRDKMAVE